MLNYSIAYALVKKVVYLAFRLSHRKIVVVGAGNIPKGKPLVFASNHQNALMDPLAVLLTNHTQPVWLARADIFKLKTIRPILKFLKIIPVFRLRDGKDNLQNNDETFEIAVRVLENRQAVALFPEGAHSGRRQMLTHKKAIPRIVFRAEEKNNFTLGVQIVPVGIYYSHYWKFNRSLIVSYGEPISVSDYQDAFTGNQQAAVLSLRDEIYQRILPLTMHIPSVIHYEEYEMMRILSGEEWRKAKGVHQAKIIGRFRAEKDLIERIRQFEKEKPSLFGEVVSRVRTFSDEAKRNGFDMDSISAVSPSMILKIVLKGILMLISLPVFLPGMLLCGGQFILVRSFVGKKVKDPIFTSSFNLVAGMLVFPFSWFIMALIAYVLSNSWLISVVMVLSAPVFGKLSFMLAERYEEWFEKLRWYFFFLKKRERATILVRDKMKLKGIIYAAAENKTTIFEP